MQLIMKHWMTRIRLLHIPLQVQDAGTTKLALQHNAGRNQLDLLSIVNHGECVAFLGFPVDLTGLLYQFDLRGCSKAWDTFPNGAVTTDLGIRRPGHRDRKDCAERLEMSQRIVDPALKLSRGGMYLNGCFR